jgi:hypothetical protein
MAKPRHGGTHTVGRRSRPHRGSPPCRELREKRPVHVGNDVLVESRPYDVFTAQVRKNGRCIATRQMRDACDDDKGGTDTALGHKRSGCTVGARTRYGSSVKGCSE